jgi:uncharacterized phage protein (TIGR02220 family)
MARIRTIKPEFWTDTKIVNLPFEVRLFFIGLWNFCDDEGFLEFEPLRLKMLIFPNDNLEIEELITLLQQNNLITVFANDGKKYIYIRNFLIHQKISHPTESKIKGHFQNIPEDSGILQNNLESSALKGKERKGKERNNIMSGKSPTIRNFDSDDFLDNSIEYNDKEGLRIGAKKVLEFLNNHTGSDFRFIDTNLNLIQARLSSGVTVRECWQMIVHKTREWATDEAMRKYLRPLTLFNKTKFEAYYGGLKTFKKRIGVNNNE